MMPVTRSARRGADPSRRSPRYLAQAQSSAVRPVQTSVYGTSAWLLAIHRAVAPTFRADTASSAAGSGHRASPSVPFDVAWIRRRPSSCAVDISNGEFPKSKSAGLSPLVSPTRRRSGCSRRRPRPTSTDGAQAISVTPRSKATAAVVKARMTSMTTTTLPVGISASIPTIDTALIVRRRSPTCKNILAARRSHRIADGDSRRRASDRYAVRALHRRLLADLAAGRTRSSATPTSSDRSGERCPGGVESARRAFARRRSPQVAGESLNQSPRVASPAKDWVMA